MDVPAGLVTPMPAHIEGIAGEDHAAESFIHTIEVEAVTAKSATTHERIRPPGPDSRLFLSPEDSPGVFTVSSYRSSFENC